MTVAVTLFYSLLFLTGYIWFVIITLLILHRRSPEQQVKQKKEEANDILEQMEQILKEDKSRRK